MIEDSAESRKAVRELNNHLAAEMTQRQFACKESELKKLGEDMQAELRKLPGWGETILKGTL